ncbi:TetR family transcriptional regulator [Nocardia arizonensis]|uniref:TetR family transcriptional regulator n=1 Tax=Nocardia arizonensis TaxID=1141647 RepID=UPI0006D03896|nr:TetR family transcriptional regulator [Nocardia arizonensis]
MAEPSGPGAAIRDARRAAGLTVRELARRLELSPATVSAIENDKTEVSVSRLYVLAGALGVPAARLLPDAAAEIRRGAGPGRAEVVEPGDWRVFPPLELDPVLAAAVEAIVETGYHGTTMRAVAKRAGLSVPGVYHHYPDKQHLLVRIFDLTMDELHWRVAAAGEQAHTGVENVALLVEALALFHTHRRKLAFIGASEMRSLTEANHRRIADSRNRVQHILDAAIDRAAAEGALGTGNLRTAGRAIATMCTSLPQWFRDDGPSTPERIARDYAEFALSLLGHTTAPS